MDYKAILELLSEKGYRLTQARKEVIRILTTNTQFLGAYDIHNLLKNENVHIGVTSIYRVLDLLKKLDLVRSEEFSAGGERFRLETNKDQHEHSHQLICSQCGRQEEWIGECPITGLAEKLEQKSGYQIEEHWLRFFGLCPQCQEL